MQDAKSPKIRHLGTIAQLCRDISLQRKHILTIGKKFAKQQYLLQNMVNFGTLTDEICWRVCGTPANFNRFRPLAALLHGTGSGRQPNFAALNRGRYLYLAGRPSRWAFTHILVFLSCFYLSFFLA